MREMMTIIAGAWHRPPAKQVLAELAAGQALLLQPEWDNQWDDAAIKVAVALDAIPEAFDPSLQQALEGSGFDWSAFRRGEELDENGVQVRAIHLGYVAKTGGKPLAKDGRGLPGNADFKAALGADGSRWGNRGGLARLSFGPNGEPQVVLDLEVLAGLLRGEG